MAVSISTTTVTVNAAFLQEIKEVNHELWQLLADLRHRCQRPIAPGTCRVLVDKLCELRDQLALHFALEEAYGYFEDPVDVAPQLCRQADALLAQLKPGDAVALLDLDQFKAVNDQWGHATGDEVLVGLARYLDRSLRDGDTVTRFGGEEFLLVLRQAGDRAAGAVERLAEGWRRMSPITTFSAGVALHAAECRPEATLIAADAALYRAKDEGCDRVRQSGGIEDARRLLGIA